MYIDVDHSYFKQTVEIIENYVNNIEKYMRLSTDAVYTLNKQSWKSTDGGTFYKKWLEQNDKSSVTEHVKAALREYANGLSYAREQYKNAQADAYTLAFLCQGII